MYIENVIAKGQLVKLEFEQAAVADSQSAVAMYTDEVAGAVLLTTEYPIPFAFDVIGITVVTDNPRTAGTLTVDATINGTVTGLQAALDATNTTRHSKKQPRGSDRGNEGDRVGVKLTTASWTPVAADIKVIVWVVVDLEGI